MHPVVLLFSCVLMCGCSVQTTSPAPTAPEWTWAEWSGELLRGRAVGEMPPVPASGWTQRHGSWFRSGAQIADFNADGKIDYLRIVDPPSSYNHRIWFDGDYDGFFDDRVGPENGSRNPNRRVPQFAPASAP